MKVVNFSIYEKLTKFDKKGKKLLTQGMRVDYKDKAGNELIRPEKEIFERIRLDGIMAGMVGPIKKSTMKRFKMGMVHPRIDKKVIEKYDEKYRIEVHYNDIITSEDT